MIGRTLNHYKVVEPLGKGGMGEVWVAEDTKLGRRVALKILPDALAADADKRGRFEREARAIAALNHPNIVTIHSVEEAEGVHFLTMELVHGERLTQRIGEQGVALDRFFDIAIPLADAVHAAHQQGIMHRDLKPDNVMVNKEGRVKVLDFGLAKLRETPGLTGDDTAATATVTAEGRIVGTISYMSPEQAEGKTVDERSDIFSLGIVLYEMATGRRPFSGDTPLSTMSAILKDAPVSVTELKQQLPRHLGRVIATCLEKAPDRRYQSALDVRNELERLRKEVESGDTEFSQIAAMRVSQRSKTPVIAGIAAGVLVIAVVIWAVLPPGDAGLAADAPGTTQRALGVIGFENLSDPADEAHLGRMLMSLVTTDLAESGGIGVVSTAKVLAAYREARASDAVAFDSAAASETARTAGADVMLVGQILISRGETMILTAEIVDVASGNTLGSVRREAVSDDELFALAGSIATDVRDTLGVGKVAREFDLAGTLTDSTEAYRQYTAGELALHANRWGEATKRFEAAIRLDPTFAWAYYRLGVAESWSGARPEGQKPAYERGEPYLDRLPERWQTVYAATQDYSLGNADEAVAALERLLRDEPDIPDAYNILGELQTHYSRHMNGPASIRNFETALDIDPTFKVVFFHLLDSYMISGDEDAIDRLIRKTTSGDDPNHTWIRAAEIYRLYIQGRYEEIADLVETLEEDDHRHMHIGVSFERLGEWERFDAWNERDLRKHPVGYQRGISINVRAWGRFERGRFDAAQSDYEAGQPYFTGAALRSIRAEVDSIVGHLHSFRGRKDEAEQAYRRGVATDPFCGMANWALGRFLVAEGRLDEARRTLADFEQGLSPDPDATNHCWAHLMRGGIALGQGDGPKARAAIAKLRPESCWEHDQASGWLLAESHELEGRFDSATEAWRSVIEPAHPLYPVDISFEIPAWHRLGAALEKTGDVEGAKRAYRHVLDAWGNGDEGILAVGDARARLAVL